MEQFFYLKERLKTSRRESEHLYVCVEAIHVIRQSRNLKMGNLICKAVEIGYG